MVIDSSAAIAFLRREPEADAIGIALRAAGSTSMSAVNALECRIVLSFRFGVEAVSDFERFLQMAPVEVAIFGSDQSNLAFEAYRRYGKGSGHPARLNLADCAAYALAKSRGEPLLFKGDDFQRTDIESAL